jgi:hypothetical protein
MLSSEMASGETGKAGKGWNTCVDTTREGMKEVGWELRVENKNLMVEGPGEPGGSVCEREWQVENCRRPGA